MNLKRVNLGLIGDPTVGKTSIAQLYVSNGTHYPRDYHLTTGTEIFGKIEQFPDDDIKVIIYDCSGKQMYFNTIVNPLLSKIDKFIFVYDCGQRMTFENLKMWIQKVQRQISGNIEGVILAHKNDFTQNLIPEDEGIQLAQQYNLQFHNTTINNYEDIKEIFMNLINEQ